MNRELWDLEKFENIVTMYQWNNGFKGKGQIVELEHAQDLIKQMGDSISFEPYTLDDYKRDNEPKLKIHPDSDIKVFATKEQVEKAQEERSTIKAWAGNEQPLVGTVRQLHRQFEEARIAKLSLFGKIKEFFKHPSLSYFTKNLLLPVIVTVIGGIILFLITIKLGWVKTP